MKSRGPLVVGGILLLPLLFFGTAYALGLRVNFVLQQGSILHRSPELAFVWSNFTATLVAYSGQLIAFAALAVFGLVLFFFVGLIGIWLGGLLVGLAIARMVDPVKKVGLQMLSIAGLAREKGLGGARAVGGKIGEVAQKGADAIGDVAKKGGEHIRTATDRFRGTAKAGGQMDMRKLSASADLKSSD